MSGFSLSFLPYGYYTYHVLTCPSFTYCIWSGSRFCWSWCRRYSFVCSQCILYRCLDFFKTCKDTSLEELLELIRFWWSWPYFQGHHGTKYNLVYARPLERFGGFSSNLMRYFIRTTLRANGLGHLDLIFKVTVGLTTTKFSQIKLLCTVY